MSLIEKLVARIAGQRETPLDGRPYELPADPAARRDAVRWAFRMYLLREVESAATLEHFAAAASAKALRHDLLASPESRGVGLPETTTLTISMTGREPPQQIEVDAPAAEQQTLFAKVQAVWRSLGEQRPHWSVLSNDEYLPDRIDGTLEDFYRSGEHNVGSLILTLRRNGIDPASLSSVLDFGCGLGRLSSALAAHFAEVHGVDFSSVHLELAQKALQQRGRHNVHLHRIEGVDDIDRLPQVDLLYSLIALQHNPPPVMRALLGRLLDRVRPGGVAVFQLPTYLAGYRFTVREYLEGGAKDMEMHALPQREVFATARAAGMEVLEVLEDAFTGYGVGSQSNTFVMRRTR